jgi:hypothetical protein
VKDSIQIAGQWGGYFIYGPEYGEEMYGEKVHFRLFLEDRGSGEFQGRSVDVEGFGASMDVATIKGFIAENFISFTKEYSTYYIRNENGTFSTDPASQKPRLSYKGHYDPRRKSFSGDWEFWTNERLDGNRGSFVDIFTGSWEMTKDA